MIEVKFKLNGREVRASDLGRELARSMEAEVRRNVEERVNRVKRRSCPEHGKAPTVQSTPDGFSIQACCERFANDLKRDLAL